MQLYLSRHGAVDWFVNVLNFEDALNALARTGAHHTLSRLRLQAETLTATHLGWEGDIRTGPYLLTAEVQMLNPPESDTTLIWTGIVWKQDNNGDTFAATLLPVVTDAMQEVSVSVPWVHHSAAALSLPLSLLDHQVTTYGDEEAAL